MNCVMRESEYDPYMVIRIRSFPKYFESMSKNEMPQITVAIWISTEYFFMRYISWKYIDYWKAERCSVERKGNDQV